MNKFIFKSNFPIPVTQLAEYVIILKEDLCISPDFSYISQTIALLERYPTVYCVIAWKG